MKDTYLGTSASEVGRYIQIGKLSWRHRTFYVTIVRG